MRTAPHSRLRGFLINGCVLLSALLVCLLIAEWGLRFLNIQRVFLLNFTIFKRSEDPRLSYELVPSFRAKAYGEMVTTNSLGFRSPEIDSSRKLLAILGDSVTFGFGVNDDSTFPSYVQDLLPQYSVLNAGVPGYNLEQEAQQYLTKVAPLEPDIVILQFCYNDFDETLKLDEEGYFVPQSSTGTLTYYQRLSQSINKPGTFSFPGKTFLQTHSAVFAFLERTTKSLPWRSHAAQNSLFQDSAAQGQLSNYRQTFDRLAVTIGSRPRLFVIWPESSLNLGSRRALREMAESRGFRVIDLYEIYGNHYDSLGWDGHPNAFTNRRTAQIVVEALREWKLIDEGSAI